jgi:hypothetical protein
MRRAEWAATVALGLPTPSLARVFSTAWAVEVASMLALAVQRQRMVALEEVLLLAVML